MDNLERHNLNEQYIQKLDPSIQDGLREFLKRAEDQTYPLRITSGYRSIEDQNKLYAQGRTSQGNIVTNAKGGESFHNFGLAVDVYDEVRGYNTDWDILERIADTVGLEHGDRGYTDLPHFQYRGGLSLQQVQAGQRPAPLIIQTDTMTQDQEQKLNEVYEFVQQLKKGVEPIRQQKENGSLHYDADIRKEDKTTLNIWADSQALASLARAAGNPMVDKEELKNPKYVPVHTARELEK